MSLKVPKAQNLQLFKDGYKVHLNVFLADIRNGLFTPLQQLSGIEDAVLRNIQAVAELSDLVRTSFGPNGTFFTFQVVSDSALSNIRPRYGTTTGRNKLLINHLGKLFVTSDAATIIREIEVVHPAAKLLVMASQAQEAEVCPPILST